MRPSLRRSFPSSLRGPNLDAIALLLDPVSIDVVCDIEVARGIHREGRGTVDLAEGRASGSEHGPVSLSIPLLDAAAVAPVGIGNVQVTGPVRRESAGIKHLAGLLRERDHRPRPLG